MAKIHSKIGGNNEPNKVAKTMRSLKSAFVSVIEDKDVAEELAFNCAEIFVEIPEIERLFKSIIQSGTASSGDIQDIERILAIHWSYHLAEIRRLLEQCK